MWDGRNCGRLLYVRVKDLDGMGGVHERKELVPGHSNGSGGMIGLGTDQRGGTSRGGRSAMGKRS